MEVPSSGPTFPALMRYVGSAPSMEKVPYMILERHGLFPEVYNGHGDTRPRREQFCSATSAADQVRFGNAFWADKQAIPVSCIAGFDDPVKPSRKEGNTGVRLRITWTN